VRILVAMSGGVDSSVAAALLARDGHTVVGVTMKLWGGPSDSGCCSVSDVDDARRVAQQLGIPHHVFNFSDDFDDRVVEPYVAGHAAGRTPNPCIECNRHIKFDRLLARASALGFDAVATGHHAQVARTPAGSFSLLRGADPAKDQSYVLYMLGQDQLARLVLPIGSLSKSEVRSLAQSMGLRTAAKPDSQDVCFISRTGGRQAFLGARIPLRPAQVFEAGSVVAEVPAAELVTVGQRRGFGTGGRRRYVLSVDADAGRIELGSIDDLLVGEIAVQDVIWVDGPPAADERLTVQSSAHGSPVAGGWVPAREVVALEVPIRRVAPGQSVVLYRGPAVVGGGIAG
jgi:tRNA-uridine 2-sulfurtransferase